MKRRLGSAIVGIGMIGEIHARAVRAAGGDLVAVVTRDAATASSAAGRLAADRGVTDWREVLDDPAVDIVHVCTPNHLHAEIAAAVIAAGKHVICEKPLAMDLGSAAALEQQAGAAGAVAAVPFVYRFYGAVRDARARVAHGEAGDLRLLHGTYLQDWLSRPQESNWRVDPATSGSSRAFGDIGVHWCDLIEFVTGQRIARLTAKLFTIDRPGGPVLTEDGGTLMFETDRGVLGSAVISQVSPGRKNRLWFSVEGDTASLQFDQENPDSLWVGGRAESRIVPRGAEASHPDAAPYNPIPVGHPMGYQDCFTAFVGDVHRAVRGEAVDGLPTFTDGLRAATITNAVLDAAKTGNWVEVP
ncbi:Gfo/Idh/MocA family oxidoreductase [Actinoplanes sp. NBRC 101535]|uniref:Gfo/Idh/MocA family protein n=1 Tax=Actinoplanes sp. NBRC 101535 TaxID=3032196 RepID=UPI0024A48E5F|nr:Gfo/Idh/MocA family oxidoreductase [Actinoplanes sp. NBRC 101535]GLY02765.1 dehydrogenase [Actinoplanes sp. NBRC 101535]